MLKNSAKQFGWLSILFHWVMAIAIITLIVVGLVMTDMPDGDQKWQIYGLHKSFGLIALMLILLRTFWYLRNTLPDLPRGLPNWQVTAARGMYQFLYLMMWILPVTGVTMSLFGGFPIGFFNFFTIPTFEKLPSLAGSAHWIHVNGGYLLAGLISIHVLAALYHHFIRKDTVLRRMLGMS